MARSNANTVNRITKTTISLFLIEDKTKYRSPETDDNKKQIIIKKKQMIIKNPTLDTSPFYAVVGEHTVHTACGGNITIVLLDQVVPKIKPHPLVCHCSVVTGNT